MAIEEVISVRAGGAVGEVNALADAFERAEAKFAGLQGKLDAGSAAGPGRLAAAWDDAAAKVSAAADRIAADAERAGKAGASLAGIGDGGKAAAAGLDAAGNSAGPAAGKLKAAGDAGKGAADALKGVGDAGKAAADGSKLAADSAGAASAAFERQAAAAGAAADAQGRLRDAQGRFVAANTEADAAIAQSAKARSAAAKQAAADTEASQRKYHALALGAAAFVGYGIDQAAKLQTQVIRLYTSAGVAKPDLPAIQSGILGMAGATGTDQSQLAQGAYMIGSAGFTKPDQLLGILKATAQGAYAEGAPLGETANALTSVLNAYGLKKGVPVQDQATAAMNEIMAMVGSGKMTMAGAVSALPQLLPAASSAGLSFGQAGGALATMTSMGMSPDQAAQNLRHTIGSLQGPNAVQTAEMYMLGLDPVSLQTNLSKAGLTGTLSKIQGAVKAHTDRKTGLVDLSPMNMSKAAAQDSLIMLKQMPPAIRGVAKAYLDGSITQKQWMTDVKAMTPLQANLAHQYANVVNIAHGYNAALKAGQPASQAQAAAISKLMGGTVGLNTYLSLTGQHLDSFRHSTEAVSASARDAGKDIKGWSDITRTAGFELKSFEYSAKATATTMGAALLPAATDVMSVLAKTGSFLASNPEITKPLMIGGGVLAASYAVQKVAAPVTTAIQGVGKVAEVLKIPGLDKLAGIGKGGGLAGTAGAAGGLDRVTTAADAAAGALDRVGAAGDKAAIGEDAAGAAGTKAAAGEEAAGSAGSKAAGGLGILVNSLAIAAVIRGIGDQLAPKGSLPGKVTNITQKSPLGGPSGADSIGGWFGLLATHMPDIPHVLGNAGSWLSRQIAGTPPPVSPLPAGAAITAASSALSGAGATPAGMPFYRTGAGLRGTTTKVDVDTSSAQSASAKIKSILAGIGNQKIQPVKVPAPDMSQVTAAKAKAENASAGIHQAMNTPLQQPVKAHAPDLGAFAAAAGPARADGAAISAGLAAGIQAGMGAAVAAAQAEASAVAGALASALQTHSPSRVTWKTGEDFTAGFAGGISSGKSKAKAKAASMSIAASTVTSLIQGLQGGQSAVDAAVSAILGKDNRPQDIQQIDNTVSTLIGDLNTAKSKKIISGSEDSALTKFLRTDQSKLEKLAARRAVLITEIGTADQTAQSVVSGASIMNAANAVPTQSISAQASSQTVLGMQDQAQQAKLYAQQLAELKKEGLDPTELAQLAQENPQAGLSVTQGLVGDKGAIGQLNQAQKQITQAAGRIGNIAGPAAYQSGQDITAATAKGLKSQLSAVDASMKQIATSMANAVKAAVGGASTQAAMKAAGQQDGQSYAGGLASQIPAAAAAGAQLAQAAAAGAAGHAASKPPPKAHPHVLGGPVERPLPHLVPQPRPGGGGHGGGGTVHLTANITVLIDGHQVAAAISEQNVVASTNNWQSGTHSPYRPA